MSAPIQAGDLVVVVKPTGCCSSSKYVGRVYVVAGIYTGPVRACPTCGFEYGQGTLAEENVHWGFYTWRLKRIPPLAELERDEIVRELTA